MRAILSVYNKDGLVEFARRLAGLGVELFSTGGTKRTLEEAGIPVRAVEEITGFPEMMDGRVKTLHPAVHGGILARRDNPDHMAQLERQGFSGIDLVAVNLYPFVQTISREGVTLEDALENIDIGGPTMLRAAAKNYPFVLAVCDPGDYDEILAALGNGTLTPAATLTADDTSALEGTGAEPELLAAQASLAFRRRLAAKAFQHVAFYDTAIAAYLRGPDEPFPEELTLGYRKVQDLRYGENPHQKGALYAEPLVRYSSLVVGHQERGQAPSLCNIYDLSAAMETVRDFIGRPAAVVIKHATPSGFALAPTLAEALEKAIHADATSAFGGIIGLSMPMDIATAQVVEAFKQQEQSNIDAIVAPGVDEGVRDLMRRTRPRMILYTVPPLDQLPAGSVNLKHVPGGILYQTANAGPVSTTGWKVATQAQPTEAQLAAMVDAWTLIRRVRSNTILIWDPARQITLGIGSGQVSRVGAARLALEQAGERARGAILASDSFFPFPDSVELAARYGVGAIVQQGGSINDKLSIEAADAAGIPMVLTGERAFWH